MRLIVSTVLCIALQPTTAHAVWEYNLAAQLAFHDGLRSTCGKIEPRPNAVLNDEWSQTILSTGMKAISSARKSQEYSKVYRQVLHEHLKLGWGDSEEEAHKCEEVYVSFNNKQSNVN
jgi:hypothetical protein